MNRPLHLRLAESVMERFAHLEPRISPLPLKNKTTPRRFSVDLTKVGVTAHVEQTSAGVISVLELRDGRRFPVADGGVPNLQAEHAKSRIPSETLEALVRVSGHLQSTESALTSKKHVESRLSRSLGLIGKRTPGAKK